MSGEPINPDLYELMRILARASMRPKLPAAPMQPQNPGR